MIVISKKFNKLLLKCLQIHEPSLSWIIETNKIIKVDEILGNQLRELVGDEFTLNGLNADYEPNKYGLELEDLIDEIGSLFLY